MKRLIELVESDAGECAVRITTKRWLFKDLVEFVDLNSDNNYRWTSKDRYFSDCWGTREKAVKIYFRYTLGEPK